MRNCKIAVFLGDFFWSSTPYDGLNLYHELALSFDVDLIMFSRDIRLNKKFSEREKFFFNKDEFSKVKSLKVINSWSDLHLISKDYDLILSSTKTAPKTRLPRLNLKCRYGVWDIGGVDILHSEKYHGSKQNVDYFFVKGDCWKDWVKKFSTKKRDYESVFSTGCPHYDYYLPDCGLRVGQPISEKEFLNKYNLDKNKKTILVMPSNPGTSSHNEQFNQNLNALSFLNENCEKHNLNLLLKTYPHDYVFYENDGQYTGIYKRKFSDCPQYEWILKRFPNFKVIESQDHFSAMSLSNKIFNIAGSSIGWETYFLKAKSISMNFSNKKYFNSLSYLPGITFPDKEMNYEINNIEEILNEPGIDKSSCDGFILKEYSLKNIEKSVKYILNQIKK